MILLNIVIITWTVPQRQQHIFATSSCSSESISFFLIPLSWQNRLMARALKPLSSGYFSWTISDKSHIVFSFFDKKFWTNCSCSCKAAILNFIHYRTGEGAWCKHQKIEQHETPDKKLKKWNSKSIFRNSRKKCTNSIFLAFFFTLR